MAPLMRSLRRAHADRHVLAKMEGSTSMNDSLIVTRVGFIGSTPLLSSIGMAGFGELGQGAFRIPVQQERRFSR
jgi:hypothetical protein